MRNWTLCVIQTELEHHVLKVSIRSGPPCRAWVRVRSIRVCWIDLDRAHVWTQSFRAYGGGQGEFKWSSQHGLCELFGGTGPEPRPVFSSPGSFAACC